VRHPAYAETVHPTIREYFDAMARHDWPSIRTCLSEDFERRGPYEDHAWDDPDSYVAFLAALLPTLRGQKVEITDWLEEGSRVHVNVTETIEVEGGPHTVRCAATFDLTPDGRIQRNEVFVRRLSPSELVG
jgi:ketosteroid isomerase-like protein